MVLPEKKCRHFAHSFVGTCNKCGENRSSFGEDRGYNTAIDQVAQNLGPALEEHRKMVLAEERDRIELLQEHKLSEYWRGEKPEWEKKLQVLTKTTNE